MNNSININIKLEKPRRVWTIQNMNKYWNKKEKLWNYVVINKQSYLDWDLCQFHNYKVLYAILWTLFPTYNWKRSLNTLCRASNISTKSAINSIKVIWRTPPAISRRNSSAYIQRRRRGRWKMAGKWLITLGFFQRWFQYKKGFI